MYKKIHSTFTPRDNIKKARRILEEKGLAELYPILLKSFSMVDDEFTNSYRIHRTGDGEGGAAGGGFAPDEEEPQIIPPENTDQIYLPKIEFEALKLYVPTHPLMDTLAWGRKNKRVFIPIMFDMELMEILGTIWVETNMHSDPDNRHPSSNETHQYYVKLLHTGLGSKKLKKDMLLGLDIGFRRYEPGRGKMFLDLYEYPKENTNVNPADITWELPVSGRKYESTEVILPSNIVDAYNTNAGGAGIKIRTYLTISAKLHE